MTNDAGVFIASFRREHGRAKRERVKMKRGEGGSREHTAQTDLHNHVRGLHNYCTLTLTPSSSFLLTAASAVLGRMVETLRCCPHLTLLLVAAALPVAPRLLETPLTFIVDDPTTLDPRPFSATLLQNGPDQLGFWQVDSLSSYVYTFLLIFIPLISNNKDTFTRCFPKEPSQYKFC